MTDICLRMSPMQIALSIEPMLVRTSTELKECLLDIPTRVEKKIVESQRHLTQAFDPILSSLPGCESF